jgi:hypothetical protein
MQLNGWAPQVRDIAQSSALHCPNKKAALPGGFSYRLAMIDGDQRE